MIPEKNNRTAEIRKASAACLRIRTQAMDGSKRLRPYHVSLEAVISATNNFLNALDRTCDIYDAISQQVIVALNTARADADTML